eukprot:CAMPEP_0178516352 /NCGR_PEP_ID=MMETSP0696-20121128/25061_1 /TAXON_ID=265572 /ORGANISM="Extubocellulus spinifer, Strain CCMP396" /LENGTH=680 /DNA_ID=CAMNT_0020146609 /DNA_START=321 /DNA_END=2363 /DNA_ORIENTATION=-
MDHPAAAVALLVALLALYASGASAGWVDPDTPEEMRRTISLVDNTEYDLVMSDEFNVPGRSFKDGHDKMWTALDKSDDDYSASGGGSLHFYNSSAVTTTKDGMLKIASFIEPTRWTRLDPVAKKNVREKKDFKSGMVQSWNKFCFTGGIVEVDVILPGDPFIGGLWPAIWILGNLGRSTYEVSTNNIWPWSYNTCNRKMQPAQALSACNKQNHYGMHPNQGRGATEIDIIEGMMGDSNGPLPGTSPNVSLPYVDMTLQVAPGIPLNRPQTGHPPLKEAILTSKGQEQFAAQTWYEGLEFYGNTSLNPFFYGTYLAETKKGEPVLRSKKQAFQADAVGAMHQLVPAHFKKMHTFRIEWQPGPGGRIDWFTKAHKVNETDSIEGDGKGTDWVRAFTLKDKSLSSLMGSQIPNEPSYLIMNTAISSTWAFPYDVPEWCEKCYDCSNSTCSCAFNPGFCNMMRKGVAMYIDHVRVYQSKDDSTHVGNAHTVGCDPPDYPTREYIKGHEYRYMRQPPFVLKDKYPLRKVESGGGACDVDDDCGCNITSVSLSRNHSVDSKQQHRCTGRGQCVESVLAGRIFSRGPKRVCQCNSGFTGPNCLAIDHIDDSPSAYAIKLEKSLLADVPRVLMTPFTLVILVIFVVGFNVSLVCIMNKRREDKLPDASFTRLDGMASESNRLITGRSI